MKKTYTNVASKPRTRAEMLRYLSEHFRYYTMNSWNGLHSYAVKIKVSALNLTREERDSVFEMLSVEWAHEESGFSDALKGFTVAHSEFSIGSNGRSGGYLVLYRETGKPGYVTGRGTDEEEDFSEWDTSSLRDRCTLVRDFDLACEEAVSRYVEFASSHRVEEKEVQVSKTVRVAVPRDGEEE